MNLQEHIPYITYSDEPHVIDFQKAVDIEWQKAVLAYDDFILQLSPITATWGLMLYEKDYGIVSNPDKPLDERRSHLIAKMRGVGTTTVEMVKNIASSFYNGDIEVIEHNDEYWFEVKFISGTGVPPNLEDFYSVLEEAKPAHLGIEYYIQFNTHKYLSQFTHRELAKYTHKQLRTEKLEHSTFNTHQYLKKFTHGELSVYTHKQIAEEI